MGVWYNVIAYAEDDGILLKNIKLLTLHRNQLTTGKRITPIAQLRCVGGSAEAHAPQIRVVQCFNIGFDGTTQLWHCLTEIEQNVVLERVTVSCEGYHYPDDPIVLIGSCGLTYSLEYAVARLDRYDNQNEPITRNRPDDANMAIVFFATMYITLSGLVFIVLACISKKPGELHHTESQWPVYGAPILSHRESVINRYTRQSMLQPTSSHQQENISRSLATTKGR